MKLNSSLFDCSVCETDLIIGSVGTCNAEQETCECLEDDYSTVDDWFNNGVCNVNKSVAQTVHMVCFCLLHCFLLILLCRSVWCFLSLLYSAAAIHL